MKKTCRKKSVEIYGNGTINNIDHKKNNYRMIQLEFKKPTGILTEEILGQNYIFPILQRHLKLSL